MILHGFHGNSLQYDYIMAISGVGINSLDLHTLPGKTTIEK